MDIPYVLRGRLNILDMFFIRSYKKRFDRESIEMFSMINAFVVLKNSYSFLKTLFGIQIFVLEEQASAEEQTNVIEKVNIFLKNA